MPAVVNARPLFPSASVTYILRHSAYMDPPTGRHSGELCHSLALLSLCNDRHLLEPPGNCLVA